MRLVLSIVLPLVLPTLVYFAWMSLRRREAAHADARPAEVPWSWLVAAGTALAVATVLAFWLQERGTGSGTYHPARVIDGRIEPGHFDRSGAEPD